MENSKLKPVKKAPTDFVEKHPQIDKTIVYYRKLITSEQFIITGSYALSIMGFSNKVKDLDIVLVGVSEESMEIIKKIAKSPKNSYPVQDEEHFRMEHDSGLFIDFFVRKNPQKVITVIHEGQTLDIALPRDIALAKKRYPDLKQLLQRKNLAEVFFHPDELTLFIQKQQSSLK